MRIVEINAVVNGSTGHIMLMTADLARSRGHQVMVAVPKCHTNMKPIQPKPYMFGHILLRNIGAQLAYYTGYSGCFNYIDTKLFLRSLDFFKPDIIHLHNLHSEYINLKLLFNYIKKHNIPVVWTLHDCWSFTGGCAHFVLQNCNKWETGCYGCKIHRQYPGSYLDNSKKMWKRKKEWFTNVPRLTVVTPSHWLGGFVKKSYLKEYDLKVIHNGINLGVFKPRESCFRANNNIEGKKIVLGVSMGWGHRKGMDIFVRLSEILPKTYRIVLVGTNAAEEKQLPASIITIRRTESQEQLSEIYSAADVFVNPTREDTFPTVNLEALACGTPVVTFKTGGSPESINSKNGIIVEPEDVDGMLNAILLICEKNVIKREDCIMSAKAFNQNTIYNQYIDLYEQVINTCVK